MIRSLLVAVCFTVILAPLAWADPPGNAWIDLGNGLAGTHGAPVLSGTGPFVASTTLTLTLDGALAQSTAFWVVGFGRIDAPFKGGVMVPIADIVLPLATLGTPGTPATLSLQGLVPTGVPHGTKLFVQCWVADGAAPLGFSASNSLKGKAVQLFDEFSTDFDALLMAAQPPTQSKPLYSSQDFVNKTFVRNPDCWAAGFDLTGISPWNATGANTRAGTLVSPRHIVFAKHFPISTTPGSNEIVFVTADDVTVSRQVVGVSFPGGDTAVGVLDSDVPPSIGFFKVLAADWGKFLWEVTDLPMLHLDQEEKAIARELNFISGNSIQHTNGAGALRFPFSETIISGDSGNAAFFLIDGEAVLALTHFTSTSGPFYTKYIAEVDAAMTALGGGYQLTTFDLGDWLEP
ncbi:MAG: hypothetical protein ACI9EF_002281 [Pseudohongiellaceae bacterium]|jgi:hypothetical protein